MFAWRKKREIERDIKRELKKERGRENEMESERERYIQFGEGNINRPSNRVMLTL